MQEALIGFAVLVVGVVIGALLTPTEAEALPLYPDQIAGAGGGHDEHGHHHH